MAFAAVSWWVEKEEDCLKFVSSSATRYSPKWPGVDQPHSHLLFLISLFKSKLPHFLLSQINAMRRKSGSL